MSRLARIFLLHFQHALNYRARSFVWFLIAFINPLMLLLFWQGVLSDSALLYGWSLNTMRSYYLLLIAGQSTLIVHIEEEVAFQDIRMGELSKFLVRPIPYFIMKLYQELPHRLMNGGYAIIAIGLLLAFFRMPLVISTDLSIVFLSIIIIICAFLISFLFKMVLAFCAFWILNTDSIMETSEVLSFALSGLIIPLNLFPQAMQNFANFTPYPYILYYPITAVLGMYNVSELLHILLVQLGFILGLSVLYRVLWRHGVMKFTGMGQ